MAQDSAAIIIVDSAAQIALLKRCRRGEASAWEELLSCFYSEMGRFVYLLNPRFSKADVEAISGAAFVQATQTLFFFGGANPARMGLFHGAMRRAQAYRPQGTDAGRNGPVGPPRLPAEGGVALDPLSVLKALDRLGGPCRDLIVLRHFGNLDIADLAPEFDISEESLEIRLHKCLETLGRIVAQPSRSAAGDSAAPVGVGETVDRIVAALRAYRDWRLLQFPDVLQPTDEVRAQVGEALVHPPEAPAEDLACVAPRRISPEVLAKAIGAAVGVVGVVAGIALVAHLATKDRAAAGAARLPGGLDVESSGAVVGQGDLARAGGGAERELVQFLAHLRPTTGATPQEHGLADAPARTNRGFALVPSAGIDAAEPGPTARSSPTPTLALSPREGLSGAALAGQSDEVSHQPKPASADVPRPPWLSEQDEETEPEWLRPSLSPVARAGVGLRTFAHYGAAPLVDGNHGTSGNAMGAEPAPITAPVAATKSVARSGDSQVGEASASNPAGGPSDFSATVAGTPASSGNIASAPVAGSPGPSVVSAEPTEAAASQPDRVAVASSSAASVEAPPAAIAPSAATPATSATVAVVTEARPEESVGATASVPAVPDSGAVASTNAATESPSTSGATSGGPASVPPADQAASVSETPASGVAAATAEAAPAAQPRESETPIQSSASPASATEEPTTPAATLGEPASPSPAAPAASVVEAPAPGGATATAEAAAAQASEPSERETRAPSNASPASATEDPTTSAASSGEPASPSPAAPAASVAETPALGVAAATGEASPAPRPGERETLVGPSDSLRATGEPLSPPSASEAATGGGAIPVADATVTPRTPVGEATPAQPAVAEVPRVTETPASMVISTNSAATVPEASVQPEVAVNAQVPKSSVGSSPSAGEATVAPSSALAQRPLITLNLNLHFHVGSRTAEPAGRPAEPAPAGAGSQSVAVEPKVTAADNSPPASAPLSGPARSSLSAVAVAEPPDTAVESHELPVERTPSSPLANPPAAGQPELAANTATPVHHEPSSPLPPAPLSRAETVAEASPVSAAASGTAASAEPSSASVAVVSAAPTSVAPVALVAPAGERFARMETARNLRRNLNSPPLPPVLQEFALAEQGGALALVDSDGSVYRVTAGNAAGAKGSVEALAEALQGAGEALSFQASGRHLTSGETVSFDGWLERRSAADAGSASIARGAGRLGAAQLRGEVQFGSRQRFSLQARTASE